MSSTLRNALRVARLSNRAGIGASNAAGNAIERLAKRVRARTPHTRIVGPHDSPPPVDAAGFYDYRGLAPRGEVRQLSHIFSLGRLREPRGRWPLREPIGLSPGDVSQHAVVFGPTGAGKTTSLVVPWIYAGLRAGYTVVAVDVRGDLPDQIRDISARRGKLGVPMYRWDYTDPDHSHSWNWLAELSDEHAIDAAVEAILRREKPNDPNPFHHRRDVRILAALLGLAPLLPGGGSISQLREIVANQRSMEGVVKGLPASHAARRDLSELIDLFPDQFVSAVSGIANALRWLDTDALRRVTAPSDFSLSRLDEGRCLLVVTSPVSDPKTSESSLALMMGLLSHRWLRGYGSARRAPVLIVLDEAPRIQERVRLGALLSLGRGAGLSIVLAAQQVGQFEKDSHEELLGNCETAIVLPGSSPDTSEWFARRLGEHTAATVTTSTQMISPWQRPQRGATYSLSTVPLLGHREISAPPFEGYPALVQAPSLSLRPLLVDLARED